MSGTRPAVVAAALTLLVGCGGNGGNTRDENRTSSTAAPTLAPLTPPVTSPPAATATPETTTPGAPATEAPVTDATTTTALPTEPAATDVPPSDEPGVIEPTWSANAAADLDALLASVESGAGTQSVVDDLLSSPIDLALPPDAALSGARITIDGGDTTWTTTWRIAVATATDPATLEATVRATFEDARFAAGARVESTLDSGVFVTLNYPPTEAGTADGWKLLTFSIGPELDGTTLTGRTELEMTVDRNTPPDEPGVSAFLSGWVREIPLGGGVTFVRYEANLVELSTTGFWMDIELTAPPDRFADLVDFYAQDRTDRALVLDASPVPADLSTSERFSAGFFPTLGGFPLSIVVERDLATPAADVTVAMQIRLEPPA